MLLDVGRVALVVGKAHLQLTGHVNVVQQAEQVVRGHLGIGNHIEALAGQHTGQGRRHHVAGVVSAAAPADDARVQRLCRHIQNLAAGQMMQLDGLAGGQLEQVEVQPLGGFHHKGQLFLCHAPVR